MAFDQNITYRATIDDSDLQAKLSQIRSSIDMTMGGTGMFGQMGMMGMPMGGMGMMPMMGMMGMPGSAQSQFVGVNMGGLADFGTQIRPVTYTPPAMAMQPHFGMIQMQQSFGQAARGMFAGVPGLGLMSDIPPGITAGEYAAFSTMQVGQRLADAATIGTGVAASTAAQIGVGAAGWAAGEWAMGKMSHAAAGALAGEAGLLGRGLLAAGGLAGASLLTIPVTELADATMEMAADNRRTQNALMAGSSRFITGGPDVNPLTGRGFGARARADIADFVQSKELQDVRFGMREMGQVLETGMQMDMFAGTRDAEDFKKRFSGLVENIKTITSVLHTSVQEGMEAIRGFRDMGITDPSAVNQMALFAETTGRAAGKTGLEMLAVGQAGAEIFRGTGISMGLGAQLNMENLMNIRSTLNVDPAMRGFIAQAGGDTALAQQMTATTLASFQTGIGRGAMMAAFNPATGQLDTNRLTNMAGMNAMGVAERAGGLGVTGMLQLQAHQTELISQLSPAQMQLFQAGTLMSQARLFQSAAGVDMQTGFLLAAQQQNVPEAVARAELAMIHAGPEAFRSQQQAAVDAVRNQMVAEDFRNRQGGWKTISNVMRREFVQPFQRAITGAGTEIEVGMQNLGITLSGGEHPMTGLNMGLVGEGRRLGPMGPGPAGEEGPIGFSDVTNNVWQRLLSTDNQTRLANEVMSLGRSEKVTEEETRQGIVQKYAFGGGEQLIFENQDKAQAFAKMSGVGGASIGLGGGKVMAITHGNLSRMRKEGQKFELTEKDRQGGEEEARATMRSAAFQDRFHQEFGRSGAGMSLQAFAGTVFGRGFKDDAELREFLGAHQGKEAVLFDVFEKMKIGEVAPGAAKQLSTLTGGSIMAGTVTETEARRAAAKAGDIKELLQGEVLTGRRGDQLSDEDIKNLGTVLRGGPESAAARGELQEHLGFKKAEAAERRGKEKGALKLIDDLEINTARAQSAGLMTEGKEGTAGKKGEQAIADPRALSQETVNTMKAVQAAIDANTAAVKKLNMMLEHK